MTACAIRSHLAEFGIIVGRGIRNVRPLAEGTIRHGGDGIPADAVGSVRPLTEQPAALDDRISQVEARIETLHRTNPISRLIATMRGVGPIIATAIAASVPDPSVFQSGRDFAAWLGLTSRQNSSGGKERFGGITRAGDTHLRHFLFTGARNVIRYRKARAAAGAAWVEALIAR
jgi:transposase